ncbi:hypothetical protein [Mycobacterium sp. AT1]|uniref:hypothetical protein n=1 Tax=Mycobacterium sp. AT1 TaxID=1961706 RepID=UPI0011522C40|nr:hypothetical protein [Mycobacterium sp. AT1]
MGSENHQTGDGDARSPRRLPWRHRGLAWSVAALSSAVALTVVTMIGASDIACTVDHWQANSHSVFARGGQASATCAAWPAAKRRIDATSALPAGWYWDAGSARVTLHDHAAAVDDALDRFGLHVAPTDPVGVKTAAHSYITAKRGELSALADRTFDYAVASTVMLTRVELNRACGLPDTAAGPA